MSAACCDDMPKLQPGNFEPVYARLFALLDGALAPTALKKWNTSGRLLKHWTDVEGNQQPAMFQIQIKETPDKRIGQIPIWTLEVKIYIYCQAPNNTDSTTIVMNPLLGAIREVLSPDKSGIGRAQGKQTLGGLVDDVYISGSIETDEGVLGQQGVAIVPIRIIQNGQ